ncbi:MAG TPA: TadE/TadG family type IV pilus assembly protein [Streptosporangiaceae bacterium]
MSLGSARRRARRGRYVRGGDRGAAAVEFALLLPLLLLLVFGIIDFGRAINAQITLTQAARQGARLAALGQPNVVSATQAAATGLNPVTVTVTPCPSGATQTTGAVVKASYSFNFVTPVGAIAGLFGGGGFGSPITLTATGEMPCET